MSKNLPASITRAYRRIPEPVRGIWTLGGRLGSNSLPALVAIEAAVTQSEAWFLFFKYAVPGSIKHGRPLVSDNWNSEGK
jgi:hypothetical protein